VPKKKPSAQPPSPGDLSDRRRSSLLEAAFELVAEKGLEGLRTRDIAARAGVNISTLHYYFGTKDALLVALLEHSNGLFNTAQRVEEYPDTLRGHFERAQRTFAEHPQLSSVLLELAVRAQREPAARVEFRQTHKEWNLEVERVLRASMKKGAARSDLDPRMGAFIVTSTIIGAMVQLGVNAKAFDFSKLVDELVTWVGPRPERGGE
jgi:AcrR family transcriptional regulator